MAAEEASNVIPPENGDDTAVGPGDEAELNPYLAQLLQGLGIGTTLGVIILSMPTAYQQVVEKLLFSNNAFGFFLGLLLYVLLSMVILVAIVKAVRAFKTELPVLLEAPKPPEEPRTQGEPPPETVWKMPTVEFPAVEFPPPKTKERRRKEVK